MRLTATSAQILANQVPTATVPQYNPEAPLIQPLVAQSEQRIASGVGLPDSRIQIISCVGPKASSAMPFKQGS